MTRTAQAYIGLGSNQENPRRQIESALQSLQSLSRFGEVTHSSLYRSPPMGPPDQPDYINAVATMETVLEPEPLLRALQRIERRQGRTRNGEHWGPRTLDLDILLYSGLQCHTDILVIPHRGLHERAFVLYPLAEIAPDLFVPGQGYINNLLEQCPGDGLERLT